MKGCCEQSVIEGEHKALKLNLYKKEQRSRKGTLFFGAARGT